MPVPCDGPCAAVLESADGRDRTGALLLRAGRLYLHSDAFRARGLLFRGLSEGCAARPPHRPADRRTEPLFPSQSVVPRYPAIGFADDGGTLCADLYEPGEYTLYWSDGGVSHVAAERLPAETELTGPWTVRFDPRGGPPVRCGSIRCGRGRSSTIRRIRLLLRYGDLRKGVHHGPCAAPAGGKVLLDLGNVQEVAVIRLNGHEFPVSWSDPCEADITRWVRPGTNRLSVDVVNLWPNRLIGDGKLPPGERRTRSNVSKYDAADAEKYLRVSGLLGPVRIRCFERVRIDGSK